MISAFPVWALIAVVVATLVTLTGAIAGVLTFVEDAIQPPMVKHRQAMHDLWVEGEAFLAITPASAAEQGWERRVEKCVRRARPEYLTHVSRAAAVPDVKDRVVRLRSLLEDLVRRP